jgi:hypothetical protein
MVRARVRVRGQTNQGPLRPCAHNFIIMISSARVFHRFGFSLRARLFGTCPAPCRWQRHEPTIPTAPAFHFLRTGTGMSTCQRRKSRYGNRQRHAALPPSGYWLARSDRVCQCAWSLWRNLSALPSPNTHSEYSPISPSPDSGVTHPLVRQPFSFALQLGRKSL